MKTKLRIIAVIFAFGVLQSCRTTKETLLVVEETTTDEVVLDQEIERFIGTIHIDETCGVTIEVIQGDVIKFFSPTNLDEKYKKEGLKIRFNSVTTGTKMQGDCSVYEIIAVSEISAVR